MPAPISRPLLKARRVRRGALLARVGACLLAAPLSASAASVVLRWVQPSEASEVAGFRVYKAAAPGAAPALVWQGMPIPTVKAVYEARIEVAEIEAGVPIWIWLTAFGADGESGPSNAVSYGVRGQPLGPPGRPTWDTE